MSRTYSTTYNRPYRPPEGPQRFQNPYNSPSLSQRRCDFPSNQYRPRSVEPPSPPQHPRHNFVVKLLRDRGSGKNPDVKGLIDQCKSAPESFRVVPSGNYSGFLYFQQWVDTREAVVKFWELRLDGVHSFVPELDPLVVVPSDILELKDRLKILFSDRIRCLIDGEEVKKWNEKRDLLGVEIEKVSSLLGKRRGIGSFHELTDKRKRLTCEVDLVDKRVREFKSAMNFLLAYIEGRTLEECGVYGVPVLRLNGDFNWLQIHGLISRECRRLEDGLPIYAYRQEILEQIHSQQIMVLIGETGSGKSTQLVQFLADSGIAADGAIVCTQPRKIAASSLVHRVKEESSDCYRDNSIVCYPAFSSSDQFESKVVYMTDHCLLQHYMVDKNLSKISCIIVDEAHERSLNTDLLLALVKSLLCKRYDLRLIIMSATADAHQLSDYFFGCGIFHVVGRNFPVEIRYVPCNMEVTSGPISSYMSDVVRMATNIHIAEEEGAILAFLTSQSEVEWACEKFTASAAVALPLHGKLSFEEQFQVFQNYPGKRKVIFATNLAETSLTIPGVKYVIDSGMVKESKFEPGSGMNVLRVCWISQSSANQRAGRAGRTEPGRCYRLYSESDFEVMPLCQEPEIRRVHLGVAVLRIFALGIKNVQDFDFVDAPSAKAIDMAIRNLVQLGAVRQYNGVFELTEEGRYLVKMGVEPRLGKLILGCFHHQLGREGIALAAVMANASSIFCRVGTNEEKQKSDCIKVKFCHQHGDLFTFLSVYKDWEAVRTNKNNWCWENSINAKTMRRCHDTVMELEGCLARELNCIIPSYWRWDPSKSTNYDRCLKKIVLSALAENVAMYSGYDYLGYEVALTGKHVQLHPSCSLLMFSQKPSWVVFAEILSLTHQYLVCVTSFDFESLSTLHPPPLFDASEMEIRMLQVKVLTGFGGTLLKRFCGKANSNLLCLVSHICEVCMDERISIKVNVDQNEISLFSSSKHLESVLNFVNDALECQRRLIENECLEKCLFHGSGVPSVALFGAGAEIKHLELQKRCLTVDLYCSNVSAMNSIEEKELLIHIEKLSSGSICAFHKENDDKEKWGRITFLSPDAAQKATELNQFEFNGYSLRVTPSQPSFGVDFSFPAVRAKVSWPRRISKGIGFVKCDNRHVDFMVNDFSDLAIGGRYIRSEPSKRSMDSVMILGLDRELSEAEILDVLRSATSRKILDFFLLRGNAVENPPCGACEEAILKEISLFMPVKSHHGSCCRVQVFQPEPNDAFMKALITFDGRLHLEAARALEHIEGKVLPGCVSWQKIKCQQLFHTSITCSLPVYNVIQKQLDSLRQSFMRLNGVECSLERNANGSFRVRISANATRTVADLRRRVEELVKGKTIEHTSLSPTVVQLLFSRDGMNIKQSLERETGTYILFDRHTLNVRVFGSPDKVAVAQQKLIDSLLSLYESKQLEIHLRGQAQPPNLMKEVVREFGPDLQKLKEKVPGANFTLNTRRHVILMQGDKELKPKVEQIISDMGRMIGSSAERFDNEVTCPICLCDIEDGYQLEDCLHKFCRLCLVEQCDSAIRNQGSFPLCCTHKDCNSLIRITDLRSLLPSDKLEELFRASVGAFVSSSGGTYRFCPSPDCPSVYKVADPETEGEPFVCGACYTETCTRCHLEYHPYLSCERYQEFKDDPDTSLKEWRKGKENVKNCPVCGYTIEKVDGCNHIECRCGRHICWVCLQFYATSDDCYNHLRKVHEAII
ncbi:hypothetical protein UlMin_038764 [Ulmus minor]